MTRKNFLLREEITSKIRLFFQKKQFHEIICPVFNRSLPLEPNIFAFQVGNYFLSTSPEATLKKAIAKGVGNCFALGKSFRDVETRSRLHFPEFLMLEWYRENADYQKIIDEVEELFYFLKNEKRKKWPVISMIELFQKYSHLNLKELINDKAMADEVAKRGYQTRNATWEQLFNQIFLNEIEPHIGKNPCFIIDFPARISPLAKPRDNDPDFAERFELYVNKMEIANGNTEITDSKKVRESFLKEKKWREENNIVVPPVDKEFLEALNTMSDKLYAGVGLGIDRLIMLFAGCQNIKEVI